MIKRPRVTPLPFDSSMTELADRRRDPTPINSQLAIWHALRERPSVAATFAEFDAVAARMGDMPGGYASGERRREYRNHRLEWMVKSGGIDVVLAGLRDNTIRFPWPDPA